MEAPVLNNEDRFALSVTGGVHLVLLIFFLLYTLSLDKNVRPSFIEVEFGEFQAGTPAEYAEQQAEQVATRPNPSETQPENPVPEKPEPVEEQQATTDETTKPVDVPDQEEVVDEEELKTPETDKVDPQKETAAEEEEEIAVPPKTEKAEVQQEGVETSGDERGTSGRVNASQGTGNETEKTAPYQLELEGLSRAQYSTPLPENTTNANAIITLVFEVTPNGNVVNIFPRRKSGNPEIDQEAIQTLRNWKFSRLPSGVPQQNQKGSITFRFVVE